MSLASRTSVKSGGSEVDLRQRNASIRNLFAPKKKEAGQRSRSQSSFSLQRIGSQDVEGPGMGGARMAGRMGMGLLPSSNSFDDYAMGINQLPMTANQSAARQYNGQDQQDHNEPSSPYAAQVIPRTSHNGWHQSAFELAMSRTPMENKNWKSTSQLENFINSKERREQELEQEQKQEQQELEYQEPYHNQDTSVDFGNEMTWGKSAEKSLPLNHLLQVQRQEGGFSRDDQWDLELRESLHSQSYRPAAAAAAQSTSPLAERLQRFRYRQRLQLQQEQLSSTDIDPLSAEQIGVANWPGARVQGDLEGNPFGGRAPVEAEHSAEQQQQQPEEELPPDRVLYPDSEPEEAAPKRRVVVRRRIVRTTRTNPQTQEVAKQTSSDTQPTAGAANGRNLGWLTRLRSFGSSNRRNQEKIAPAPLANGNHRALSAASNPSCNTNPIMAVLRTMKLKERLVISLGATLVLLTLLLIVDVQMDFGVANRHLLQQQHHKIRLGNDYDATGGGGMLHEFKRKFLQKSPAINQRIPLAWGFLHGVKQEYCNENGPSLN
ncbi:uncharacterized protein LOC108024611 isoform X2 [Drosophila biarmipes]|uniref:uncharacterized protein LOC108024611 isoform X2 n=1 Tax=Drosophila biarmipes TaxID=125945 RepID=UPI001CDAF264|nr:uncharacterized protein LOC108024611 isoform X2 [Drosophila biarmipes]